MSNEVQQLKELYEQALDDIQSKDKQTKVSGLLEERMNQMGVIHEQATGVWDTGKLEHNGGQKCKRKHLLLQLPINHYVL